VRDELKVIKKLLVLSVFNSLYLSLLRNFSIHYT
jgi:hypothetical protein